MRWWTANREAGKTSLLFAYPLGKAQRLLAALDATIGPLTVHDSVERYSRVYRDARHRASRTGGRRRTLW